MAHKAPHGLILACSSASSHSTSVLAFCAPALQEPALHCHTLIHALPYHGAFTCAFPLFGMAPFLLGL